MKTLAVIENELFKDYVKIVSTDDLEKTLDNPDVPVPFTCLKSVENNNADALATHLASFFQNSKVKNKEFYVLNPESSTQLQFMFDLINLSSGGAVAQPTQTVTAQTTKTVAPVEAPLAHVEPVVTQEAAPEVEPVAVQEEVNDIAPAITNVVEEEPSTVSDFAIETPQVEAFVDNLSETPEEIEDPFLFTPTVEPVAVQEETPEPVVETNNTQEVTLFGIAPNSTLHFFKNDSITATLIDNTTVNFNGDTLTFNEAAKAAFKKAGSLGVANGLSNWLFNGKTLKELKEQNA